MIKLMRLWLGSRKYKPETQLITIRTIMKLKLKVIYNRKNKNPNYVQFNLTSYTCHCTVEQSSMKFYSKVK